MEVQHLRIDNGLFETVLRKKLSDETVQILGIASRPMSEKGLNFLSDLYEASIRYTVSSKNGRTKFERTTNFIIKVELSNEVLQMLVRQQNLFLTELRVLRDVMPKIKQILGQQLGPQLWYGSMNPPALIMEDLRKRKFIMKDRQKGLSFEHCRLAVEQIAKLHAGSVAVFEKNPGMIDSFRDGGIVSVKCPKSFLRMMEVSLIRIGKEIRTWSDEKCANTADKLIKLSENISSRCIDAFKSDPDEFCVLNHGDCWINNMMFRENEKGQPIEHVLVDYQMSVYTSPAIDLIYFLNICPEFAVKYDNDDYFLEIYLDVLQETMRNIGCKTKPPTIPQLKEAIYKRRIYAVFSGVVLYLRMMANKEDTEDFILVLKEYAGETKMDVFKNPDAVKLAHKMIPVMNERGYFD